MSILVTTSNPKVAGNRPGPGADGDFAGVIVPWHPGTGGESVPFPLCDSACYNKASRAEGWMACSLSEEGWGEVVKRAHDPGRVGSIPNGGLWRGADA